MDTELKIISANPTMESWYDSAKPLIGKTCYEVLCRRQDTCPDCAVLESSDPNWTREEMIPRWGHDGVISGWLQVFSFPLWEPDTQLSKGVIKYLRDITKEKEAETSLKRVNRALRCLNRSNEALVRVKDERHLMERICEIAVHEGGYVFAWVGLAAHDEDKMVHPVAQSGFEHGYSGGLKISWADNQWGRGPVGTAIRTAQPTIARDVATDPRFIPWKKEALMRGYKSCAGLPLLTEGQVVGALALYSGDLYEFDTEEMGLLIELADDLGFGVAAIRKSAAAQHAIESEKRLLLAAEQSVDAVMIQDADGRIQYVNPAFQRITGYSADEVIGKVPRFIECEEENPEKYEEMWDAMRQGEPYRGRLKFRSKDGRSLIVDLAVSPVRDASGTIVNYIRGGHEVTEQVRLEQQLFHSQKMEAIGTLAGGIAHDFNNMLFAISGYTELALEKFPEKSQARSDLERVLNATKRAGAMVKQILTFSRQSQPERKPLDLAPVVKEGLKFLRASIPTTTEIRQYIQPGTGKVIGDPAQIHQILMNFCTNAVHAMRDTKGVLSVELARVELDQELAATYPGLVPGKYVRLTVSDTGHGIPREILDQIFEPYFTTKKAGEGTGLGLSVVHGIVKGHGGTITVHSALDKGTTFHVYLPLIEEEVESEVTAASDRVFTGHERILFVDDEQVLVELAQSILEGPGYKVATNTKPVEALELFRTDPQRFDLVITDLTMPGMTGEDLAGELKTIRPDIPVIICTGFSQPLSEERVREPGIAALITKPILKSDIGREVRRVLDNA